jgi:amino acid adenylation domain-containing protein
MTVQALLEELRARDIWVWADGNRLQCSTPAGVPQSDVSELLRQRKTEILEFLRGPAALSFSQQRLWFLDQIAPGGPAYVVIGALELRGALNAPALERALRALVNRHEALRTVFVNLEGEPRQVVSEPGAWTLPVADLSAEADKDQRLRELLREEATRGFDLARGPLFRARLYRLAADSQVLLLAMHHIISDGWSIGILIRELGELYGRLSRGEAATLPALKLQYRDFARWQRGWLKGEVLESQLGRWRARLAGAPQVLELPADRARPAVESFRGAFYSFTLPRELAEALRGLSRREGATLFMTLLAGFTLLLSRYSGQQDLLVGTPVANRSRAEIEDVVGCFVNTLVLRADLSGELSVRQYLARMREVCLDAYAHQDLPFERLVEELQPQRDMSRNPVFQVMFALQNAPMQPLELPGLTLSPLKVDAGGAQVDLMLNMQETADGISGWFNYATDLFDESSIVRMFEHLQMVFQGMVGHPQAMLKDLPLLTEFERHQLLVGWNATAREYGSEARLHRLIEAQAKRTPDAVALEFEGRELTYAELNARANQLARVLRARGVGPGVLVGVFAERSFEMVVALLAVLKAGGAYVPLDSSYPRERLGHVLEDARAPLVLAQPYLASALPAGAAQVLELDASWAAYAGESGEELQDVGTPEDLAYVIFTSGSTGRPKGAMNAHRGICNRLLWMQEEYGLTGDDRVLQKTPFSFDVSVWEFFWPLMTGARLVIARPEGHRDSAYLARLIRESRITTLHFVPSMLRVFLEEAGLDGCRSLKRVICSGEALPHELQERFFARLPAVELHNLYGPTEAAVDVTYWACRRGDERLTVPIGRPVANTQIYVLDAQMRPVPVGVAGELYIGGVQVGRGYVGRPELTAERFVADPFSLTPGARLYKTGDLARHLADGAIEYLGRLDYQVKIRGQRIELGEIEATLDRHPGVGQSVVLAREDTPGDQRLVAYVVPREQAPSFAELKAHLSQALPPYMVPAAYVFLETLPLTSSGKVDRKALPAADGTAYAARGYEAPVGEIEITLAQIWAEVLRLERVGRQDHFFELGGHSLLATQVISRARHKFDLHIPLKMMFEEPNLAGFADYIATLDWSRKAKKESSNLDKTEKVRI